MDLLTWSSSSSNFANHRWENVVSQPKPAVLRPDEITKALTDLPDWRTRLGVLYTAYVAPSAAAALALVAAIGEAAEAADHHPDLDWRYDHVFLRTTTHQAGHEVTERDVLLATEISTLAAKTGARAEPALAREVEIGIDTPDPKSLEETWITALGYRRGRDGDLVDPWGRGPNVWFQQTSTPDASRMHIDLHVASETALESLDAIKVAGGVRLDDQFAPSWWVVADADGNRLCVCTPDEPE